MIEKLFPLYCKGRKVFRRIPLAYMAAIHKYQINKPHGEIANMLHPEMRIALSECSIQKLDIEIIKIADWDTF